MLLVTWLWQGLAVAVMTALVLGCARRLNAATRYVVWWLALVAVLVLPAAYVSVLRPSPGPGVSLAALPPADAAVLLPGVPDWLFAVAIVAWMIALLAGLVRVALGMSTVFRLKRVSRPLDPARSSGLAVWNTLRGTGRQPRLHVSERVGGACALGLWRPVILVSRSLADRLDDQELDLIVLHERAHLERYDDWAGLAEAIVFAVAGLHPAVWFIGRRIRFEREAACDDRVVARTGAVREYARSLVQAAASSSGQDNGFDRFTVPGAIRGRSALGGRVRRLLDPIRDRGSRLTIRTAVASAALLLAAVTVGARSPALIVLVDTTLEWPRVAALGRLAASGDLTGRERMTDVAPDRPPLRNGTTPDKRAAKPIPVFREPDGSRLSPRQEPLAPPLDPIPTSTRRAADIFGGPMELDPPPAAVESTKPPQSLTPWAVLARSGTSTGQGAARVGTSAGARARDAGLSIGRFFSRTGKSIADSY
jgi:beta-lactamase regulating signal transducer with metallopeptidase domain